MAAAPASRRLVLAGWPVPEEGRRDEALEAEFQLMQEIVREVRSVRQKQGVPLKERVGLILVPEADARLPSLDPHLGLIAEMAGSHVPRIEPGLEEKPEGYASAVLTGLKIFVELGERHDAEAERDRLLKLREKEEEHLRRSEARLSNEAFLLDRALRLLHPLTPFITEEIWGHLNEAVPDRECFS
ncbi:MAG: class I tRNA ligase family protein, partial [Planctomycetota bacterium]